MPLRSDPNYFNSYEDVFCAGNIPFYHFQRCTPTLPVLEKIRKLGVPLLRNRFTPVEDARIKQNWIDFARLNDMPISSAQKVLRVTGKHGRGDTKEEKKLRKALTPFLARGLPFRLGSQVCSRASLILHPDRSPELFAGAAAADASQPLATSSAADSNIQLQWVKRGRRGKGSWSVEDDVTLLREAARRSSTGKTWLGAKEEIGDMVGRTGKIAAIRVKTLGSYAAQNVVPPTPEFSQRLVDVVCELTPSLAGLRDRNQLWRVTKTDVDWVAVGKHLGLTSTAVKRRWFQTYRFRQLFLGETSMSLTNRHLPTRTVMLLLVRSIRRLRVEFDEEIDFELLRSVIQSHPFSTGDAQLSYSYTALMLRQRWMNMKISHFFTRRSTDHNVLITLPKMLKFIRRQLYRMIHRYCMNRLRVAQRAELDSPTLTHERLGEIVQLIL